MGEFGKAVVDICTNAGSKIILAIVVWFVGKWIIERLLKIFGKVKAVEQLDPTLTAFLLSVGLLSCARKENQQAPKQG